MKKLKRLRAERGLTMDVLEERTGVSKRTISELERGMRVPQILTLAKLARALGVDLEELSEEEVPKAPAPSPGEEYTGERRTLEERRPFSRLHLLVSIMERDTKRWRQAVTSGSVKLGMVEEASAHQTDMSEELLRVVEEADRERWSVAELGLLRRVLFEEAWPTWKQAGEELLKALIASYTDDELAAVRRRRAEAQQAVSATQEALDRVTGA